MIQRIQSVFLILTTVFAGLFLAGHLFKFTGDNEKEYLMNARGISQLAPEDDLHFERNTPVLFVLSVSVPLVSLLSVFLFKNRKLQMKITLVLLLLIVMLIIIVIFTGILYSSRNQLKLIPQIEMFIPLINLLFVILAYRGIKKDDDLVRSYDRLR